MSHHTSVFTKVIDGKDHTFEMSVSKQEDGTFILSNFKHTPPEGWTGWPKPATLDQNAPPATK